MAKIKTIVRVMNLQSLLNVDKAKKKAEKYKNVGDEVTEIISKIVYNKNVVLDKNIVFPDVNKPKLNIYIANDYGFCGNFNSSINSVLRKEKDCYKIIIGSKIVYNDDKVLLKIAKEDFYKRFNEIEKCIEEAIYSLNYSEINVYYNHYYSSSSFDFLKVRLFPVRFNGEYFEGDDFVAETDLKKLISGMLGFYICYQLKMCESISYAAENVLRSQITSTALDKIAEKEEIERNQNFKKKKENIVKKSIENYKKIM